MSNARDRTDAEGPAGAMNEHSIARAITPLRLIFWGGLLCIFDITVSQTTNGQGFKFDFLNDAVGALLIAIGVFRLGEISVHRRYGQVMGFLRIVSVLAVAEAVLDHFIIPLPMPLLLVLNAFGLLSLVAIAAFCVAMRWFCDEAQLIKASQSWNVTLFLFVVIYLFPLGLFYVVGGFAIAAGRSFNIDLGPGALLLILIFVIPVVHLFVSTSRMKREAEALAAGAHL